MWIISSLAEAASDAPPQVPYEFFGVVASALIAGITGVVVAILQRTKRSSSREAAPESQGSRPFTLSETDWCTVRDRTVSNKSALDIVDRQLQGHITQSDEAISKIREDIANIKGQLGI